MIPRTFWHGMLAAGLLLGLCLMLLRAAHLETLGHDDGISLLAATCHQGQYAISIPDGEWVQAGAWQAYVTPDRLGCFITIGQDLAQYDVHPPLYFWLLHLWVHLGGIQGFWLAALNIVILMTGAWLLFLLAKELDCSPKCYTVAILLWLLTHTTLTLVIMVRMYALLGCISILFLLFLVRFLKRPRFDWLTAGLLVAAGTAGLLTQYWFVFVYFWGGAGATILLLFRRRLGVLFRLFWLYALSSGLFMLLHPNFLHSFVVEQQQAIARGASSRAPKLRETLSTLLYLELPPSVGEPFSEILITYWLPFLLSVLVIAGGGGFYLSRRRPVSIRSPNEKWLPGFVALMCMLVLLTLAFSINQFRSPSPRQLVLFSPFLFLFAGQLFQTFTPDTRMAAAAAVVLVVYQFVYGAAGTYRYMNLQQQLVDTDRLPAQAALLVDSVARGVLPRILLQFDPQTRVLAETQSELLRSRPELPADRPVIVYLSDTRYGNTLEQREDVREYLNANGYVLEKRHADITYHTAVFEFHAEE